MERAALATAEEIRKYLEKKNGSGNLKKERILTVCGSGNNGGDGIAIARLLHLAGIRSEIYLAGNLDKMTEETRHQWDIAMCYQVPVMNNPVWDEYTVIVDGIFGVGLSREITGNYKEIIDDIVAMDLKAIKIHPDYQNTFFDDEKYLRLIDYAANKDLGIIVHAGEDVGLPSRVHCTPDMVLNLWKHIQPEKLILAHLGGWRMWDEVEEKLAGLPMYFDTAVVLNKKFPVKISQEQFARIVRKHGADKVIFGTDTPWYDQKQALEDFEKVGLSEKENKIILGENANNLFNFF